MTHSGPHRIAGPDAAAMMTALPPPGTGDVRGGERMAEVRTRYGAMSVPDVATDVIGRFLGHYGEWAWDEARFVASVLPDGASLLDVGAFLGTFGLGVSMQRPLRSLCFVEASPRNAPFLERNVRRNATVSATVVEALVAGGVTDAARPGHAGAGNLGSTSYAPGTPGDLPVAPPASVRTLAQLREEHGPFDLIKLDVEGMELEILQGDAAFLSGGGTAIWVECNETPASLDVADLLLSWGLDVHYFAFPSHNPDNLRGAAEAVFPLAFEAGLLAAPRSAPVLDDALRRHGCILEPIWSGEDLRRALWRTPRWGMPEWQGRPAEQVAALAGRALRGDALEDFLTPGWTAGTMLWDRVPALEAALDEARRELGEAKGLHGRLARETAEAVAEAKAAKAEAAAIRHAAEEEAARLRRDAEAVREENRLLREEGAAERHRRDRQEAEQRAAADRDRAAIEKALAEASVLALDRLEELEALRRGGDAVQGLLRAEGERSAALEAEARRLASRLEAEAGRIAGLEAELDRTRAAAGEAARLEAEARQLAAALGAETERAAALEAEVARLREVDERLGRFLGVESEVVRLSGLEDRFHTLEALHRERMRQLDAILGSATWRLMQPVHRALATHPVLHRLFRLGRRTGGRIARMGWRRKGSRRP